MNSVERVHTALRLGQPDRVPVLEFVVDEEGNADRSSIRALNSTHMAFESPATRMIEGCRFRPARIRGQAVKVLVRMPVNFVLPEQ